MDNGCIPLLSIVVSLSSVHGWQFLAVRVLGCPWWIASHWCPSDTFNAAYRNRPGVSAKSSWQFPCGRERIQRIFVLEEGPDDRWYVHIYSFLAVWHQASTLLQCVRMCKAIDEVGYIHLLQMRIHVPKCAKHLMSDSCQASNVNVIRMWDAFIATDGRGLGADALSVKAWQPFVLLRCIGRGESKECEVVTVFETMDVTLEKFLKDFGRLGDLNCCLAERTATSSGDHRSCILNQISGHIWSYYDHIWFMILLMINVDHSIDDLLYAETSDIFRYRITAGAKNTSGCLRGWDLARWDFHPTQIVTISCAMWLWDCTTFTLLE